VRSKEEIAAYLRKVLKVNVKFEKLSREELLELAKAVEAILGQREETKKEDAGPLGLGVIPAIREQLAKVMPEIRKEVRRAVEEVVFGALSRREEESREG